MAKKIKDSNKLAFVEVTTVDLPLCCPMPKTPLWSEHPRVYLPITETGEASCPYCGTQYFLKELSQD